MRITFATVLSLSSKIHRSFCEKQWRIFNPCRFAARAENVIVSYSSFDEFCSRETKRSQTFYSHDFSYQMKHGTILLSAQLTSSLLCEVGKQIYCLPSWPPAGRTIYRLSSMLVTVITLTPTTRCYIPYHAMWSAVAVSVERAWERVTLGTLPNFCCQWV